MLICVDIDNTLANTNVELVKKFNIKLNTYPTVGVPPDFFKTDAGRQLLWNTEPFPYAITSLHRIYNAGYEIAYISSRPKELYFITKRWLIGWGFPVGTVTVGLSSTDKVNFVHEEGAIGCFDDDPEVAIKLVESGVSVWLKDWPYNSGLYGQNLLRFKSWREVARLIIPIAGLEGNYE